MYLLKYILQDYFSGNSIEIQLGITKVERESKNHDHGSKSSCIAIRVQYIANL